MTANPASPFGADTLTLDAVVSPAGPENALSPHDLAMDFGGEVLTLPAVLLPAGGTPPAGEWLNLGVLAEPPRGSDAALAATGRAPDRARPADGSAPAGQRPDTLFNHPRGLTPTSSAGPDPIAAAAERWREMRSVEAAAKARPTPPKVSGPSEDSIQPVAGADDRGNNQVAKDAANASGPLSHGPNAASH